MDVSWIDRISLFRYALLSAALAGVVCPLVGNLLYLRRTSFYGIALPQLAAAGTVLGFVFLPVWLGLFGDPGATVERALAEPHAAATYHLAWASAATLTGLAVLTALGRRGGSEVGRLAVAFAGATSATYVLGRFSPVGKSFVDELLQGEVLGIGLHEFEFLAAVLLLVAIGLGVFGRRLLLASFDREFARTIGVPVGRLELLLNLMTGLTVAISTITLGPTLLFGLLVVPPVGARQWCSSLRGMQWLAPGFGLVSVIVGVVAAFELDLPLGAAIVAASIVLLVPGWLFRRP